MIYTIPQSDCENNNNYDDLTVTTYYGELKSTYIINHFWL